MASFKDEIPSGEDLARWLGVLQPADHAIEIRAPDFHGTQRTFAVVSRFAPGQIEAAVREARRLSGHAPAVYLVINGVSLTLPLGRELKDGAKADDIPHRFRLLIDCDPTREGTVNATAEERFEALKLMEAVRAFLRERGFPEPITADSGNGYHLVYAIDLPNDAESTDLVKAVLAALATRFDTATAKVDCKVFDAPRLVKFYGTQARKGKASEERPHRYSRVLSAPAELVPVAVELLRELVAEVPPATPELDLEAEIERKREQTDEPVLLPLKKTNGRPDAFTRAAAYLDRCEPSISGNKGHNAAFKTACKVGPGFNLSRDETLQLMRRFNQRCEPPWSEKELAHKVDEAFKVEPRRGWLLHAGTNGTAHGGGKPPVEVIAVANGQGEPPGPKLTLNERLALFPRTDLGNAERLVSRHGLNLRYCHPWKKWLVWDGKRWKLDSAATVRFKARKTVRAILNEIRTIGDIDERKSLFNWQISSEKRDRIAAFIYLTEAEEGIPVQPDDLDQHPWLLNCFNGTLDLKTLMLHEHRREDLITQLCPVPYVWDAECPLWIATLDKIFAKNQDMVGFVQRLFGYCLTGTTTEQILPILYGTGSNGKSTILNVLMTMIGTDYTMKAMSDLLMVKRNDAHPTDKMDLFGKRLVVAIETEEGARMDEPLIKELTGSDKIRGRRMREDSWEFDPTHKVLLCTNHKPVIKGTDHAIWRRPRLIPFNVKITDADADLDMPTKLLGELPGILAWCVQGLRDWQENGLNPPSEVILATEEYRKEEDILGAFLDENCTVMPGLSAKAIAIYSRFCKWAGKANHPIVNQTRFGKAMTERGFSRSKEGTIQYNGIGLCLEVVEDDSTYA